MARTYPSVVYPGPTGTGTGQVSIPARLYDGAGAAVASTPKLDPAHAEFWPYQTADTSYYAELWAEFHGLPDGQIATLVVRLRDVAPVWSSVTIGLGGMTGSVFGSGTYTPATLADTVAPADPIAPGGAELSTPVLAQAGMRVVVRVYPLSTTATEAHAVDLFDAYFITTDGRRRGTPPLRLTQRGDGLTGGAPRLIGRKSRQSGNRLLGGFH